MKLTVGLLLVTALCSTAVPHNVEQPHDFVSFRRNFLKSFIPAAYRKQKRSDDSWPQTPSNRGGYYDGSDVVSSQTHNSANDPPRSYARVWYDEHSVGSQKGFADAWAKHHLSPPHHLDVALPPSIINSDESILIHLKDQQLWDQERSPSAYKTQAALVPSFMKATLKEAKMNEMPPEAVNGGSSNGQQGAMTNPRLESYLLKKQLNSMNIPFDVKELDELFTEYENNEERQGDTHQSGPAIFARLQNLIRNNVQEEKTNTIGLGDDHGYTFNLYDIADKMKERLNEASAAHGQPRTASEKSDSGYSYNIRDIIEEVLDKNINEDTEDNA